MKRSLSALCAVGALSAGLVAGCGSDDEQQPQPQLGAAETVMVDALSTAYTINPQVEEPGAGWDRARHLLDPSAPFPGQGEQLQSGASSSAHAGSGEVFRWRAHGVDSVTATARILADDHPEDTDTTAMRVVQVDRLATGDEEPNQEVPLIYYATATKHGKDWLLSNADLKS